MKKKNDVKRRMEGQKGKKPQDGKVKVLDRKEGKRIEGMRNLRMNTTMGQ